MAPLLAWTPCRKVRLDFCRPKVVIISDASWEPNVQGLLCWWVYPNCAVLFGHVCHEPPSFWKLCQQRETQIVMAEILAALLPVPLHPSLCVNAAVTAHVDSIAALAYLVQGNSKSADLAHAAMIYHCILAASQASAWFEWVPSLSNPADGGSRVGTPCRLQKYSSQNGSTNGCPLDQRSAWNESSVASRHIILGVAMGVGNNGKGRSFQTLSESVSESRGRGSAEACSLWFTRSSAHALSLPIVNPAWSELLIV